MTKPVEHKKVIYFCGILASNLEALNAGAEQVIQLLGRNVLQTEPYEHKYTQYYDEEMGEYKLRKFIACLPLESPTKLREIKLRANDIEDMLASRLTLPFSRPVNLDPGYIDEPRIVLASCKDYNHRIAIGEGVYADLHLIFSRKQGYVGMDWSYMDYTDDTAKSFFMQCRQILRSERLKTL
ncbi:MAG: DUF4416 family protein [Planctomycetes bacterium]|nr:DUF4416 family protein [Planctomycetota bacterium]